MKSVSVIVSECLGYDGLRLLVVGKVVRPDILTLQGSMECLYVPVLLRGMCPDELEVDAQDGGGFSELFANILGSVVTLKGQPGTVWLGCSDGLDK